MLYRYRWWLALGLVLFFAINRTYYDFYPIQNRINELQEIEMDSQEKLNNLQTISANKMILGEKSDHALNHMSIAINMIEASGLDILSVNQVSELITHVDLEGSYRQWMRLINALQQKKHIVNVVHFYCRGVDKNHLQIGIDLSLLGDTKSKTTTSVMRDSVNPFCVGVNEEEWLQQINAPILQIKMVGYLQLGTHSQALILMPDKKMINVEIGSVLGLERGVVVGIYQKYIVVKLPEGKEVRVTT